MPENEAEELREKALKCDPETETAQMIQDAGYQTKPSTDAVDESLYCDLLMDSLNEQAGVAHVERIESANDGSGIQVTFSLPFGGSFTHRYERPDERSHDNLSIQELLDITGGSLDNLTGAVNRPVYIEKDGHDSWSVNHATKPSFDEEEPSTGSVKETLNRQLALMVSASVITGSLIGVMIRFGQNVSTPEAVFVSTVVATLATIAMLLLSHERTRKAAKVITDG